MPCELFNGGLTGRKTQQLSWVIKDYLIPNEQAPYFFKGGINDYTPGIAADRIYQNICENMDSIKAVGTNPVYQKTLCHRNNITRNRKIDELNRKILQFCAEKNCDFVDLSTFLCKNGDILDIYFQDDDTHLKPETYPKWAEAIKPVIIKYGL
jgi:lysophospholipase L1-like esterase